MPDVQRIPGKKLVQLLTDKGLALTDRRLRQIADEGFYPPPVAGEYETIPTLIGLILHRESLGKKKSGALAVEQLRKLKEEADKVALENDKTRGKLVEIEAVYKHFEGMFVAFRSHILASTLSDQEKDELLNNLRGLKARDVAKPVGDRDDSQSAAVDTDATAPD